MDPQVREMPPKKTHHDNVAVMRRPKPQPATVLQKKLQQHQTLRSRPRLRQRLRRLQLPKRQRQRLPRRQRPLRLLPLPLSHRLLQNRFR